MRGIFVLLIFVIVIVNAKQRHQHQFHDQPEESIVGKDMNSESNDEVEDKIDVESVAADVEVPLVAPDEAKDVVTEPVVDIKKHPESSHVKAVDPEPVKRVSVFDDVSNVQTVSDSDFEKEILKSKGMSIVLFACPGQQNSDACVPQFELASRVMKRKLLKYTSIFLLNNVRPCLMSVSLLLLARIDKMKFAQYNYEHSVNDKYSTQYRMLSFPNLYLFSPHQPAFHNMVRCENASLVESLISYVESNQHVEL